MRVLWGTLCTLCGTPTAERAGILSGVCWACAPGDPAIAASPARIEERPAAGAADCGDTAGSAPAALPPLPRPLPPLVRARLAASNLSAGQQLVARSYLRTVRDGTGNASAALADCARAGILPIHLLPLVAGLAAAMLDTMAPACPGCARRDDELRAIRFRARNLQALLDEAAEASRTAPVSGGAR